MNKTAERRLALASDICNLVPDEDLQRWQAAIAKAKGGEA